MSVGSHRPFSTTYDEEDLQVNTRAVLAARTAGHGRAGLTVFAGMMGMEPPLSHTHYPLHNMKVWLAIRDTAEANMLEAVHTHFPPLCMIMNLMHRCFNHMLFRKMETLAINPTYPWDIPSN